MQDDPPRPAPLFISSAAPFLLPLCFVCASMPGGEVADGPDGADRGNVATGADGANGAVGAVGVEGVERVERVEGAVGVVGADGPGDPPQDVFRTDLIAFPDPWAFELGSSHIILVADRQLEDLAADPDRPVNLSLSASPRPETLRQICERAQGRGHRTLAIAFDYFWAQYRTDVRDLPRRLWPDTDRYIELVGSIARFASAYGLGLELSLLSPLEIGRGYRAATGEGGRWMHYREGPRDPASGAYSVQLWRQESWTNNKGTVAVEDAGIRVFAFRERRLGGTHYHVVRPEDIVDISETARVEVFDGLRTGRRPSAPSRPGSGPEDGGRRPGDVEPGYSAVRIRVHGEGMTDGGPLDRVLVVQVYETPEMDYFSDSARPYLRGLVDRYVDAGVRFNSIYADETHIQGDWGYFQHHDHGELAVRYVSPGFERSFAARHGPEYADFARWLVYFARGQHDWANDLTARSGAMHVPGPGPADVRRAALLRARYYELLQDGVVDLFVDAKTHLERRMGHQVHSRAHATWAQSPTIDSYDVGAGSADAEKYEYTSSFLWSNTVHQAATACHDLFKWGDFLHGTGNDTTEGGFLDRNYWGFAIASSLGVLNRVRNAYAAHWGMPEALSRRRSALRDAWGAWPSWPHGIVQDMEHREVEVLMLYPLDLVAADERFGSWMTQYAYANWITQAKLLERGRVADGSGSLEVGARRYTTLVATFEPFPRAALLDLMERFARVGGRLVWSGPPPLLTREGGDALGRWEAITGVRHVPTVADGIHAAGRRIEFSGVLQTVEPMTILTDLLPDRLWPVEAGTGRTGAAVEETEAGTKARTVGEAEAGTEALPVARARGRVVGAHRRLGKGTVTTLGFRPRDDQSGSMGHDVRHWFDILSALGAMEDRGADRMGDNTERVSRTTPFFAARFPNGAVSVARHLRDVEECWPGGFHRDPEADRRIVAGLELPSERLDLAGFRVNGHVVEYRGVGAVSFRVDRAGTLIAFAGRGSDRIRIDGREWVFADRPLPLVAWAPVPGERRVEGGAGILVRAAGAAELRIPAEAQADAPSSAASPIPSSAPARPPARVFREGPTPGSRGEEVECRIERGRLVFRSGEGEAWYYVVPAAE